MTLTRRALLAVALAAPFGAARAATPLQRVVALDWGWAATMLGLGLRPTAMAEQRLYRDWVGEPALPEDLVEVGLRTNPSLDTLAALQPDLILTNDLDAAILPRLQAIAPTLSNPTFAESRTPLENSKAAARLLGDRLGRSAAAEALVAGVESRIALARDRLTDRAGRSFLPVTVVDRRHLVVYGEGSLFSDVMRAVGLRDLWPGATSLWGHAMRPVTDLAGLPPGDLLLVDPLPPAAADILAPSGLLARLCAAEDRSIHRLPPVWGFGDVTAAARFADLLAAALGRGEPA